MKLKSLFGCFLIASTLAFAGCVNRGSPESTLSTAGKAVMERNLNDFRKTLVPELDVTLGNSEQMEQIRDTLVKYTSLGLSEKTLVDTSYLGDLIFKNYSVTIDGSNEQGNRENIFGVKLRCKGSAPHPKSGMRTYVCLITEFSHVSAE